MSATLSFLGAAGTVTGSRFLLRTPAASVLVECGLFQGEKALRLRNWEPFPIEPAKLDAVVLTHAHIDHSGYLPRLVAQGFRGPVFVTQGTAELCRIVLPDSGRLHEEDAAFANRQGFSRHTPALPLYTEEEAIASLEQLRVVDWEARVEIAPKLGARFTPAGHILGASCVTLEAGERRLLVTGDLGRPLHPVLAAPAPRPDADVLVCESTYGDRSHPEAGDSVAALGVVIARALDRGGSVVIPAFAVDRTEVVLHALRELVRGGKLPGVPVYVDSPMALRALSVYRRAIAEGWREVRPELHGSDSLFDPGNLREVRSIAESRDLEARDEPCVIVSASGMATGGRVLRHLAKHLPNPRSTVVLVGYQVPGTRGARLARGERAVKMLGRYVPVRAEIAPLGGFSVHADAGETLAWLRSGSRAPEMSFAVHGEPAAAKALADRIDHELGWPAVVPRDGETVAL